MLCYHITCLPDNKDVFALSAPPAPNELGPLVLAVPDITDPAQLWQLVGFAYAGYEEFEGAWNTFFLLNKQTGRVAQAPADGNGNLKENTQGVTQVDLQTVYNDVSEVRLWTFANWASYFIIQTGYKPQVLTAWDGLAKAGVEVGVYAWDESAPPNELWVTTAVWA